MPQLGIPELVIILVIVLVIFGVGRLPEIGGAIGKSIREFRESSKDPEAEKKKEQPTEATAQDQPKA
jgi:sec-independent protein translocase protein TatA